MCDLGMLLGVAQGAMEYAGKNEAADANAKLIRDQQMAKQSIRSREYIIEANASNKEANKASREAERAKAEAAAAGAGVRGPTAGLRSAEQSAQGSLSIAAAKDRLEAAEFNYIAGSQINAQEATNKIAINDTTRGSFIDVATAGVSNYGAFS